MADNNSSILASICRHIRASSSDRLAVGVLAVSGVVVAQFVINRRQTKAISQLQNDLCEAKRAIKILNAQLEQKLDAEVFNSLGVEKAEEEKEIRIWMDGAFDMMHYGHMNAFRQGKALGTYLIVGVNSDETITQCKGAPVTDDAERYEMVQACRWVDEVVPGVPYIMSEEYLAYVIEKYDIDYVVHGDDPCIVDGKDVYESAKRMNKYRSIPRTEGISTTDIVGRMLLMTKSHHSYSFDGSTDSDSNAGSKQGELLSKASPQHDFSRKSDFLTTSRIMRLFSAQVKSPGHEDVIVYLAGSWDMFHAGHAELLRKSRDFGTYIIVGVHSDPVVNAVRGHNFPILNMHERILSVMGCKYVDDVLFDAPYEITDSFVAAMRINIVVTATDPAAHPTEEDSSSPSHRSTRNSGSGSDPYRIPREKGILRTVDVTRKLTVFDIIERIQSQRARYQEKYARKKIAEDAYYDNKYGRAESASS